MSKGNGINKILAVAIGVCASVPQVSANPVKVKIGNDVKLSVKKKVDQPSMEDKKLGTRIGAVSRPLVKPLDGNGAKKRVALKQNINLEKPVMEIVKNHKNGNSKWGSYLVRCVAGITLVCVAAGGVVYIYKLVGHRQLVLQNKIENINNSSYNGIGCNGAGGYDQDQFYGGSNNLAEHISTKENEGILRRIFAWFKRSKKNIEVVEFNNNDIDNSNFNIDNSNSNISNSNQVIYYNNPVHV